MRRASVIASCLGLVMGLVACGAGGDDSTSDLPTRTAPAPQPSAPMPTTESPAPTPTADPNRPVIELPDDVTVSFEAPADMDNATAQLVADFEQFQRVRAAVHRVQDMHDPRWQSYMTEAVRLTMKRHVLERHDSAEAVFGDWQTYDVRVPQMDEQSATVIHCENQSQMGVLDLSTGAVSVEPSAPGTAPSTGSLVEWRIELLKDDTAVWRVNRTTHTPNAEECRR